MTDRSPQVRSRSARPSLEDRFTIRRRVISPAGFERFFQELSGLGGALNADPDKVAELNARYGQKMQPETVPELLERFGLRIGEPLSGGWTR